MYDLHYVYSIDQLVCEYNNCTDEAHCVRGYEVCDESRFMDYGDHSFICITVFHRNTSEMKLLFKGCFVDQYSSSYNDTCVLQEYPTNYYSCECNSNLCNNNGSLIIPSNHTFTIPSTGKLAVAMCMANWLAVLMTCVLNCHTKPSSLLIILGFHTCCISSVSELVNKYVKS